MGTGDDDTPTPRPAMVPPPVADDAGDVVCQECPRCAACPLCHGSGLVSKLKAALWDMTTRRGL